MDIGAFAAQARNFAASADEAGRHKLVADLYDLVAAIEPPVQVVQRLIYEHLRPAVMRVGCDLGLFDLLDKGPLTVNEIAEKTGAAPTLTGRILRFLASIRVIDETAKDTFAGNAVSKMLTIPAVVGGLYHNFHTMGPTYLAIPDFLAERGYGDIEDPVDTMFQKAWNTDEPGFVWLQRHPRNLEHFMQFMVGGRLGMPTWLDVYDWRKAAEGLNPEQPFFVDVGGGLGSQCVDLKKQLPDLSNRIILQDLPAVLEQALHPDAMVHDFFEEQPVKGARIYYMRNIMHDYPDDKAVVILRRQIAAMGPDSVLLMDDMVIPDVGAHWQATQLDMTMLAGLAARERTRDQWYQLAEKAGLRIKAIYTYTVSLQDSIIECVPADR